MSLYNTFDKNKLFAELADGLPDSGQNPSMSAAECKAAARSNLGFTGGALDETVGTVGASDTTVASELSDGITHTTILTLTDFLIGTSGDNGNLALGNLLYTFPSGGIVLDDALLFGGVTAAISVQTDTPEIGLGTVQGTGAVATLSTTLENIIDGGASALAGDGVAVAPDTAGTATIAKQRLAASQAFYIKTASTHTVYLNAADGWADVTAAGNVTFTGTVILKWRKL